MRQTRVFNGRVISPLVSDFGQVVVVELSFCLIVVWSSCRLVELLHIPAPANDARRGGRRVLLAEDGRHAFGPVVVGERDVPIAADGICQWRDSSILLNF
jgi:hypothetical protein